MDRFDLNYDPIQAAADAEDLARFRHSLFEPIWEISQGMETQWVVQSWIPEGYLVILAGEPKVGKTCFATNLALAVATGTPFAGMPTVQSPVLWLALEEHAVERRQILQQNPLAEPSTPLYTSYHPLLIDQDESLEHLAYWIRDSGAKLIVIDPLQAATSRRLTDGASARRALAKLKRLCQNMSVSAIVLHHAKAPTHANSHNRVADHAQLAATASMSMVMAVREASPDIQPLELPSAPPVPFVTSAPSVPSDKSELKSRKSKISQKSDPVTRNPSPITRRLLSLQCRGRGDFANCTLHFISENLADYRLSDNHHLVQASKPQREPFAAQQILNLLADAVSEAAPLCVGLQINPHTVRNNLTYLRAMGLIKRHRRGRKNVFALASWTAEQVASAPILQIVNPQNEENACENLPKKRENGNSTPPPANPLVCFSR